MGLSPIVVLESWMSAGVRLVQLRAKRLSLGPFVQLAEQCAAICTSAGSTFIVNDRADVASLIGASGVHLGQDDLAVADARLILTPTHVVGVSTHSIRQVSVAIADQADYIAIGPVFETSSKEQPDPVVGLGGVRDAAALTQPVQKPLVAIGGITLESAPKVIGAGADSVAVISDLVRGDWRRRASEYVTALS